jgi:SSS family solute:Na+ symporter
MAQRLLAARSERDAQKGLLAVSILAVFYPLVSFIVGCLMRIQESHIPHDDAFVVAIMTFVPEGLRGLLIAGLMAAFLSTVDGMLTASSALFARDFYSQIIRKDAKPNELKKVVRIAEGLTILIAMALVPIFLASSSVMEYIQTCYALVFGVVVAIYLIGMFTKRIAPWSGFIAMISSVAFAVTLYKFTDINFAYIGVLSSIVTVVVFFALSVFEQKRAAMVDLENLTVYTLSDAKGPWVGLKAWPGLWKWALALGVSWFVFSYAWESLMRYLANS